MILEENWAVEYGRAAEFFRQQPDLMPREQGFQSPSCIITLTPIVPDAQSIWATPRTILRIEGPEQDAKELYRRFFLRFLSAGG